MKTWYATVRDDLIRSRWTIQFVYRNLIVLLEVKVFGKESLRTSFLVINGFIQMVNLTNQKIVFP